MTVQTTTTDYEHTGAFHQEAAACLKRAYMIRCKTFAVTCSQGSFGPDSGTDQADMELSGASTDNPGAGEGQHT